MSVFKGYLQHGSGQGPFRTEEVLIKEAGWPKTGQWVARYEGKWRLVHVQARRTFIVYRGERITIIIKGI